ncbi:hypothetical protein O9929_20675 [Vibrio lentus]|nr:hypothetical protein [Vibrio lentus]
MSTSTVTLKIVDGDLPTIDLVPGITLSEWNWLMKALRQPVISDNDTNHYLHRR